MLTYVSDAIAFLHYLLDDLPPGANKAFKKAEDGQAMLYLPTIAAAELYHLFEKKRWRRQWVRLKAEMKRHTSFNFESFNEDILNLFEKTGAREIHDKIIVSTAKFLKAEAILTKDRELRKLGEVKAVW